MIRNKQNLRFAWVGLNFTTQLFFQELILLKSVFIVFAIICIESELYNNDVSPAKRRVDDSKLPAISLMYIKNKRGTKLSGVIIQGNNMLEILDHYLGLRTIEQTIPTFQINLPCIFVLDARVHN